MARYNQEWDDLGRKIQNIVDSAINTRDYQKLNETINETINRVVDAGGEVVRKARDSSQKTDAGAPAASKPNLPALYGNTGHKSMVATVKAVGGGVLSLFTLAAFVSNLSFDLWWGSLSFSTVLSLCGLAVGVWLTYTGITARGRFKRFKVYRRTLGQKTQCSLEKLAKSVNKNVNFVRKEVGKLIDEGLFIEGHLDAEQTYLLTSHETYHHFEESRHQYEQQRKEAAEQKEAAFKAQKEQTARDPQVQEVLDRGDAFVAEIRRCNDAIPGEEISGKIYRMEHIVEKIFDRAEEHPEIVPDLKKLMDYYLPMTVKLLNAYADMDAQPIQGETIQNSKREIEATLDTLNLAFEKLLDDLFRDTAMDLSSDISVLNTLLAQEGLTEDEFDKMKKQNNL